MVWIVPLGCNDICTPSRNGVYAQIGVPSMEMVRNGSKKFSHLFWILMQAVLIACGCCSGGTGAHGSDPWDAEPK